MKHVWKLLAFAGGALLIVNLCGINPVAWITEPLRHEDRAVEQTPPSDSMLLGMAKTQDLRAASGEFSVAVHYGADAEGWVKSLLGDSFGANSGVVLYHGSVDALVDLSGLTSANLRVDPQGRAVTISVPEPRLSRPSLDPTRSSVVSQNRGVLTRLGEVFADSPLDEKEALDREALTQLAATAADSNLINTARESTTEFLEGLGRQLGYDSVTITFDSEPGA